MERVLRTPLGLFLSFAARRQTWTALRSGWLATLTMISLCFILRSGRAACYAEVCAGLLGFVVINATLVAWPRAADGEKSDGEKSGAPGFMLSIIIPGALLFIIPGTILLFIILDKSLWQTVVFMQRSRGTGNVALGCSLERQVPSAYPLPFGFTQKLLGCR